jgi:hypothetical protein
MHNYYQLIPVSDEPLTQSDARRSFSVFGLGIVDLLEKRLVPPADAEFEFFNAQIIKLVKRSVKDREAIEFIERGSQLADLYDALPREVADKEFARELEAMRKLCEKLWAKSAPE